jgi:FkbM family methyltransferase
MQLCANIQSDTARKAPIVTVPVGLAESAQTTMISVPNSQFGMGSMAPSDAWKQVQGNSEIAEYRSEFTTLDSVLSEKTYPIPDFLKIDVEGAELLVLRGAAQAFAEGFRPLMLIELFAPWERAFEYGPWDVLSYLTDLGYSFLFACPHGLIEHIPSAQVPFPQQFEQGYNVVAFVASKHSHRIEPLRALQPGGDSRPLSMMPPPIPNRLA